jgi:hypothetical protein
LQARLTGLRAREGFAGGIVSGALKKSRPLVGGFPLMDGEVADFTRACKVPPMCAHVSAPLKQIIDLRHSLLAEFKPGGNLEEFLLQSWRRAEGYTYFFNRADLPKILEETSGAEQAGHEQVLRYFMEPRGVHASAFVPRDPCGSLHWNCFTPDNAEYICAVNRFGWMPGMALAARRAGTPESGESVFAVMDNWIDNCPVPEDVLDGWAPAWRHWYRPWAPLNAANRMRNWVQTLHVLWDSPALTAERFGRHIRSIRQHVAYLTRVSPRLDPSAAQNHYLMEMEAVLYGSLFPWVIENPACRGFARHELLRCLHMQVLPDGAHVECAPGYHHGSLQWFGAPLLLCELNGLGLPGWAWKKMRSMLEFGMHLTEPNGTTFHIADGSANKDCWFSERLMASITGRKLPVETPAAKGGLLSMIRNMPKAAKDKDAPPWPLAKRFPNGGFATARSSWKPDANAVVFKPEGYGGAHSDADFLGVWLVLQGRLLIDEKGTWAYNNDEQSVAATRAPAHSVLLLGARDMFAPVTDLGYFSKNRRPCVSIKDVAARVGKSGSLRACGAVVWPDGASWSRSIDFDPKGVLKIRDTVDTKGRPENVAIQFYLRSEQVAAIEGGVETRDAGQPNARLLCKGSTALSGGIQEDCVYTAFKHKVPARLVTFHAGKVSKGSWETVVRLV